VPLHIKPSDRSVEIVRLDRECRHIVIGRCVVHVVKVVLQHFCPDACARGRHVGRAQTIKRPAVTQRAAKTFLDLEVCQTADGIGHELTCVRADDGLEAGDAVVVSLSSDDAGGVEIDFRTDDVLAQIAQVPDVAAKAGQIMRRTVTVDGTATDLQANLAAGPGSIQAGEQAEDVIRHTVDRLRRTTSKTRRGRGEKRCESDGSQDLQNIIPS
jgi:hypothetical protein